MSRKNLVLKRDRGGEEPRTLRVAKAAGTVSGELDKVIQQVTQSLWGSLPVVPNMETGATDGLYIRNAGIPVYGLSGIAIDTDDFRMNAAVTSLFAPSLMPKS